MRGIGKLVTLKEGKDAKAWAEAQFKKRIAIVVVVIFVCTSFSYSHKILFQCIQDHTSSQ